MDDLDHAGEDIGVGVRRDAVTEVEDVTRRMASLCHDRAHLGLEDISGRVYQLVSTRLPADQAVRMLLKPLMLPHRLEKWLQPPLSHLARRVIAA